ncbi:sigma intracellular receptor 2 [Tamandua tetradactyla]|uniref:sigma intracellular receptor 2 n=1 Tax=Tamandua tetradactyla TaxID=48850 RepID=UPI0040546EE7
METPCTSPAPSPRASASPSANGHTLRGPRQGRSGRSPLARAPAFFTRLQVPASAASASAQPSRLTMGVLGFRRVLEWILGFYFLSHIPITLFLDLQALLPRELFPVELRNLLNWYNKEFKDPLMQDPPTWFKSLLFCELVFQLPFFPIATYAFFKGGCKWIRTPAIIYSVHLMSVLIPILSELLFGEFSKARGFKGQGPETFRERLILLSFYAPYFLIPFMLLLFMLRSPYYKYEEKRKKK